MYKKISIKNAIQELKNSSTYFFDFLDRREDEMVMIYEEDTTFSELNLDWYDDGNTTVYIFKKNLTIDTNLWNEERDFGIDLLVLGDLKAHNIAVGGQLICIHGNLIVEDLLCGSYNHGAMYVYGNVKAKLILCDDYTFCFKKKVEGKLIEGMYYTDFEENGITSYNSLVENKEYDYWDFINNEAYDANDNSFDFEGLIKRIKNNETLLVSKEEKWQQFSFNWNYNNILDMIRQMGVKNYPLDFVFSVQDNSICYKFYTQGTIQHLRVEVYNESFEYCIEDEIVIQYSKGGSPLQTISMGNNLKTMYRASCFLKKLKVDIQDFNNKKDSIIQYSNNLFLSLKPNKHASILSSLKLAFYNPIRYYSENLHFFVDLTVNYENPKFLAYALIQILQRHEILISTKCLGKLSNGLIAIDKLLKIENIDLALDTQNHSLKLGRRLHEFKHNLLIINHILKEKNIPFCLSLASIGYSENGLITFCIVKNELKDMIEHLFKMVGLDVLKEN